MGVSLPNAPDFDAASIEPQIELEDSNDLLDNTERLNQRYEERGYMLFRDVLDRGSVDKVLHRMMAVMARYGVVAEDATEPVWAGAPSPGGMEESEEFKGICKELVEHPANLAFFEKLLGEKPSSVPIVQYRSYSPGTPAGMAHQDGFYSPGTQGYRPVWMPLMKIDREVGGLALAPGLHKKGALHNLAKPRVFPIPAEMIPPDSWATTTFYSGDVLVIHPQVP